MSTERVYKVSAHVAPGLQKPPEEAMAGPYWFGPHDAARAYVGKYMPSYTVLYASYVKIQDTEAYGLHTLWRASAIDHAAQLGADIWIREL